jgi:predicted NBD/HSP70 family sugar kinase
MLFFMSALLLDIGGTKCSIASASNLENVFELVTADYKTPENILARLAIEAAELMAQDKAVDRVGISFGGPFDFANQKVKRSVHVSGWEEFDFSDWSMRVLALPAVADNDANVGALGEFVSRGSKNTDFAYVTISTGIGAGLIVAGEIFRGHGELAGELGHIVIDPSGPEDESGNHGTLDAFLLQYSTRLAAGLSTLVRLINPELLVLGGGIAKAGPRLESALLNQLQKLLDQTQTKLELSTLGNANVLIGARELAKNELRG